jgi:hypothetical protein
VNLHSAGISESEIVELIQRGIGVGQRNRSNNSNSNINGSISGKVNELKFKLDDRLNV